MAAKAEEYLQTCVDRYLKQDCTLTPGTAPHMQSLIITVLNLIDPVLSTEVVTPEKRKRILAKLAFIGYVVGSQNYWSPARGYSGFANMTSVVALYRTAIGCMLPSHPRGKAWAQQGLAQLYWQLGAWSDQDGGWVEAPHYAMVSFDHMLAGFTMAANAGYSDHAFDPRMRKVIEWFAAISTPRDNRTGGFRHQPPIGNTYHGEMCGLYGMVAALWKERDPDFAAQMQWLFEQHGSFKGLGIGWNFPSMLGYRFLMDQSGVTPKPADLKSAWFRNTGVVLRNTMRSDRETYLHLIAGRNHAHYDVDSGSIMLYGKGRVLADDWGYIGMHPDKWHSMLTSKAAPGGRTMQIKDFSTQPGLDYVSGHKGGWQRQIAFAKDADPLGPTFFLIRDTHNADAPATWRLWLTTKSDVAARPKAAGPMLPEADLGEDDLDSELDEIGLGDKKKVKPNVPSSIQIHAQGATVSGADDVDLDIFIYEAGKLGLRTETATQRLSCGYRDGKVGPLKNTQTALIATLSGRGAVTALLYPRLKKEKAPTVTWHADGRIAKVVSVSGTDYVFVTPKLRVPFDGKSLRPLNRVVRNQAGYLSRAPRDENTPSLMINKTAAEIAGRTVRFPARSIALHPGPRNPATAVWRSPVKSTVSVTVRLKDGDDKTGDGILYELRHGAKVLWKGSMANGAKADFAADKVRVRVGDLLRLVVFPGKGKKGEGPEWCDTTVTEWIVRTPGGKTWDLRRTVLDDELGKNPFTDAGDTAWWACEGDAEKFDPKALSVKRKSFKTADGKVSFKGTAGAVQIRGKRVTLTLGAAGEIRVGRKKLAAENARTQTTTR